MSEAENVNEDDPKQMASLMRKFTSKTGINLGDSMEEAISRMEAGEDPDQVEKEMGDQLGDDDFSLESVKMKIMRKKAIGLMRSKVKILKDLGYIRSPITTSGMTSIRSLCYTVH